MSVPKLPVPDYSLTEAARIRGVEVDTLLTAAEVGTITLVHIIYRDKHAPSAALSENSAARIQAFINNYAGENGRMAQEFIFDSRLRISVDNELIHRIRAGERICKTAGDVYGDTKNGFVWFSPYVELTLDNLRVPAEELERIRREASEKPDSPPSPEGKRKQSPRKVTVAKVVDRGKTLAQNGMMPEFETVWDSIKTMAPTGTQYCAKSNLIATPEGEKLTEANARRGYEKHRSNPH